MPRGGLCQSHRFVPTKKSQNIESDWGRGVYNKIGPGSDWVISLMGQGSAVEKFYEALDNCPPSHYKL